MKNYLGFLVMGFMVAVLPGCASSSVERVPVEEVVDLSGRWNDTDSRTVAQEMIDDVLRTPWVDDFQSVAKRPPVVIVGPMKNQTEEHINSEVFTKNLEHAFVKSGRVRVVASRGERPVIRQERNEQQDGNTAPETVTPQGRETGADFMLTGSMNTVRDQYKGRYVILYQVNLELVDMENNQKVWIGQSHLKKIVRKTKYSL
jgi:penicillin-binding protein activator